jgi:hypothetical protein
MRKIGYPVDLIHSNENSYNVTKISLSIEDGWKNKCESSGKPRGLARLYFVCLVLFSTYTIFT